LAKLVEDDHQYAAVMYEPTAKGASAARPPRTRAKMSTTRPNVASASDNHRPPPDRSVVETVTAGRSNITFAAIAPTAPPMSWAGR
jgi:hypothetical protein